MTKYNFELKKKIVEEYEHGDNSYQKLATRFGVSNPSIITRWVANYRKFGDEGLICSKQRKEYTFEEKLYVVELYLSSNLSMQEAALQVGMSNPTTVNYWVNLYRVAGPEALKTPKKGSHKMSKKFKANGKKKHSSDVRVEISPEYVQGLEERLHKLEVENAILKEVRRLYLEDEAKMREWHESSTVSEENSN